MRQTQSTQSPLQRGGFFVASCDQAKNPKPLCRGSELHSHRKTTMAAKELAAE
ncbi:Hypothetical protein SynRCC307_0916 [Synechococcus sp. RCC307]|nr:Hypothetical protein SynRCC307_0916 [Synechococcus sp. RCC307]